MLVIDHEAMRLPVGTLLSQVRMIGRQIVVTVLDHIGIVVRRKGERRRGAALHQRCHRWRAFVHRSEIISGGPKWTPCGRGSGAKPAKRYAPYQSTSALAWKWMLR